ncbi:YqcC family protein [Mangrovitalea sediminis]|uniref:YqcC family protein n=1 Tax=Mangrovitalea sediminis TaxID=1982043 RepID=UPI001D0D32B5|nr:YqcC family protein [Mangrovitalea sediminis]
MPDFEDTYIQVADLMLRLEAEMRRLSLWEAERPSPEALASTEPFCIDTLTFPQWLQFIFLERLKDIVEAGAPLPQRSEIHPLAVEYFKQEPVSSGGIVKLVWEFDQLILEGSSR